MSLTLIDKSTKLILPLYKKGTKRYEQIKYQIYHKTYNEKNKEKKMIYRKANYSKTGRTRYQGLKRMVIEHYSGGVLGCACCGESEYDFLTIDHMNNDGHGSGGHTLYKQIIKDNFPVGLRVLCWNCNCGRRIRLDKMCPHGNRGGSSDTYLEHKGISVVDN